MRIKEMFDLIAKNKGINDESFSWFFWRAIMEQTGAGYVLGFGYIDAGHYVYENRNASPMTNDGFEVTNAEAISMAMCCRGYVSVKRYVGDDSVLYREMERFAKFAEQSGGFRIK